MIRSHPVLTACALTLLLPAAATAGPIEWEVSAQLARVGDAVGPWAYMIAPEYIGGSSTIHEQTFARLAAEGPHTGWGWQSVRVGSLFADGLSLDPLHGAPGTFAVGVTVTDRASGQTGTATFTGAGWETIIQDYAMPGWILSRRASAELSGETQQPLTIDGTEYVVGLRAVARDGIVDFFADVRAGAVHATPEPGTLALGALGFGALGLRRRFRRGAVALVALLLAPQFAAAGPLSWGFRAEAPDGTVLRDVSGLTDTFHVDHFLGDPQYHGVFKGGNSGVGFRTEGWETEAKVTITDEASGVSGDFRLWWRWVKEYEVRPDGSEDQFYEGYNSGPWSEPVVLSLGDNSYRITGPGGDMQVSITTPEPGTLALAGLGLAALGLRRRVRQPSMESDPAPGTFGERSA